jgi:hypothetical protein
MMMNAQAQRSTRNGFSSFTKSWGYVQRNSRVSMKVSLEDDHRLEVLVMEQRHDTQIRSSWRTYEPSNQAS